MKELKHLGIIMDGNRRWSKKNNEKNYYKQGIQRLKETLEYLKNTKIKNISLYVWSQKNDEKREENQKKKII